MKKTENCFQLIPSADRCNLEDQGEYQVTAHRMESKAEQNEQEDLVAQCFTAQLHLHQYDLHGRKPALPPHHKIQQI